MRKSTLIIVVTILTYAVTYSQQSPAKPSTQKTVSPALKVELEKLQSTDINQQLEGAFNIGNMGAKAAPVIPVLIERLKESSGMVAVDKAALKYFGDTYVMQGSDGNVYMLNPVNTVVTDALGKIGEPAAKALTPEVLKSGPNDTIFVFGVEAMAKTQDATALTALLSLLKTGDWNARDRIASSLRHSKSPEAIDALIGSLKDVDKRVNETAARSLKKITGQDFGMDAAKWEAWHNAKKANEPRQ